MIVFPKWFHDLSIATLLLGGFCTLVVFVDIVRHPQKMGVMNVVWPVTAAFGTILTLWGYFRYGRASSKQSMHRAKDAHQKMPKDSQPFPAIVGKGTSHCGAGCMIGDLIAEWLVFMVPTIAVWFGWKWVFEDKMFATWVVDFIFAYALGIGFQYFAIAPMRGLSLGEGILAALKADTLSLAAWQVGMYGFMAIAQLFLFPYFFGRRAEVNSPEFWFAMQVAMIAGFVTAYPVNWWLIRTGIKEKM